MIANPFEAAFIMEGSIIGGEGNATLQKHEVHSVDVLNAKCVPMCCLFDCRENSHIFPSALMILEKDVLT